MATHLDPNFAEAYVLLGDVAYDSQNLKEARQMWEKAQTLDPKTKHIDERLNKLTNEQSVEGSFDKMSAAYFDLRFQDGIGRDTGFDVRQHLLDARRLVGSDFRYWPKHQIIVLLYDHETYRKSRTDTPEWSGGAYDGKIRIPVPDKQYMEAWAKQVIYHEYTHALVHDLAGNNCPQWFNEGLAEYQGHRDREARIQQLAAAHAKGTVPTWEELNTYFSASSSAEHAALGYQTAHSIVAYLAERYGFWRLRQVLADLGSGINFQEALEKALKTKPNRIEANWRAWLPRFITRGAKG
jgi:tetratricopeptide (TPR) repeat protein